MENNTTNYCPLCKQKQTALQRDGKVIFVCGYLFCQLGIKVKQIVNWVEKRDE